ncbi:MAG: DUF2950 domain-containing protein [Syntrophales bacterium]|nr:DUF2950 domain-containing protein [Syntrophales bacterium]
MFQYFLKMKTTFPRQSKTVFAVILLMVISSFQSTALATAALRQESFKSPESAVKALAKAIKKQDRKALLRILGHESEPLVMSGDKVQDRQNMERFSQAYEEKNRIEKFSDRSVKLFIGTDDWLFPFPLVKMKQHWHFDIQAGKTEVLHRRIGKNELSAVQVCLAIMDAQRDYADLMDKLKGHPEYAPKFTGSREGKGGLYWDVFPGEEPSPLGPLVAQAHTEGYNRGINRFVPYHGYLYKILLEQGEHANSGARHYVVNGKMIGGAAAVAFPAQYGVSGIHTFMVNQEGIVYRKDLGKETAGIASAMIAFDPDKTWEKEEQPLPQKQQKPEKP